MVSEYKADRLPIGFCVGPASKTRHFGISQAEIAYQTTQQHPEKCFVARPDRVVLDDELAIFEYSFDYSLKLGLFYSRHSSIKSHKHPFTECIEYDRFAMIDYADPY
ncbi:MAG: hypothetical protein ABJB34_12295 [Acidobacteriota bacterium]